MLALQFNDVALNHEPSFSIPGTINRERGVYNSAVTRARRV